MNRALVFVLPLLLMSHLVSAKVLLIGKNETLSFDDMQANFTPRIKKVDQRGVLYIAEPVHACLHLTNNVTVEEGSPLFVLIIRGGCSFEEKIRNAQRAGYTAAIVYDNDDSGFLVSMAGNPYGVHIYATFVSKATGEILKDYISRTDIELWVIPSYDTSTWSIMGVSFIVLFTMAAVLATCFFVRRHRFRRLLFPSSSGSDCLCMTEGSIRRMPTMRFNGVCEDASTSASCAICLRDYKIGVRLRILPCNHKFHVRCVDTWLFKGRSFCPVCKHDARTISNCKHASEHTYLLSPSLSPTSSFSSASTTPSQSFFDLPIV